MQVAFSPEEEIEIGRLALAGGIAAEEFVRSAALHNLERGEQYRAAVAEGIASADRGETISNEEMWARIDRILNR